MCKIFFFNKFHLNRTAKTDAKKKQSRVSVTGFSFKKLNLPLI